MSEFSEDDLVSTLIKGFSDNPFPEESEHEFHPESHYNYYGDRGVADLFVRENSLVDECRWDFVYEVKSESAVESATGANEILRQFNRMRKYYYKDESNTLPDSYVMELSFVASEKTFKHVIDNIELYLQSSKQNYGPKTVDNRYNREIVTLRYPNVDDYAPLSIHEKLHPFKHTEDFFTVLHSNQYLTEIADSCNLRDYILSQK